MNVKAHQFLVPIIVVYVMLYEWRSIFEVNCLVSFANFMKFIVPILLFIAVFTVKNIETSKFFKKYILFFALFMVGGFFSSLFSTEPKECMVQWSKFLFLFIFFFSIYRYLLCSEGAIDRLLKIFIVIAVLTVIQYILLEIVTFAGSLKSFDLPTHRGGIYCGPWGILGQGSGDVYFKSMGFSLFRLYGFWLEPSNTTGFLLACAFFAESLFIKTKRLVWRIFGIISFCGGILTFSNTAYLAIAVVGVLGEIIYLRDVRSKKTAHCIALSFYVFLIIFAVFGRAIVAKYYPDNIDLRYVSGVRDAVDDPYRGRLELAKANFNHICKLKDLFLGIGFRIPGQDAQGRGYPISSNAPIYWFIFAGIIGLSFLILRELQVVKAVGKNIFSSILVLRVVQAWVALFVANLSYGTWMNPFYLITVAAVFLTMQHLKNGGDIE